MDLRDVLLNHPLNRSDRVVKIMVKKLVNIDNELAKFEQLTIKEVLATDKTVINV